MKTCIVCQVTKPIVEFRDRKTRKGEVKKNNKCTECLNAYSRAHYKSNTEMYGGKTSERRKSVQVEMLNYLSDKYCIDCQTTDFRVLEFDHLREKKTDVSRMVAGGYAWASILKEIAKCEIVCCNCHRIRSFKRVNSYKIQVGSIPATTIK